MAKKLPKEDELSLAGSMARERFTNAIKQSELGAKEWVRAEARTGQFLDSARTEGGHIKSVTSYMKARDAAKRSSSHYELADLETNNLVRDAKAVVIAEVIKPSVAGEGSDELPKEEQKKKDEFNRKVKMAQAIKSKN